MALSEWRVWDERAWGPPPDAAVMDLLMDSYIRRQRWLARLQGVQTINTLGEAMGGETGSGKAYNRISPTEMYKKLRMPT